MITLIVSLFCSNVSAKTYNEISSEEIVISEKIEYLEDGNCVITTITQKIDDIQTFATTKTATGSKTRTIKDDSGDVLYSFKINGTFIVNLGVSASCSAVSCQAENCNFGWELESYTTSKTGNTAKAIGVFKKKILLVTTQTAETSITLSCDSNGVLS